MARVLSLIIATGMVLSAQQAPSTSLTVAQAVDAALRNYPSIRVTQEQMNAAAAGIRLAQTAYLPRVDGLAQMNRATRNTFYGLLLPQGVIPGVDGVAGEQSRFGLGQRLGRPRRLAAVRLRFACSQRRYCHSGARPRRRQP